MTIYLDPMLFWTILAVVVAVIGLALAIRNPFEKTKEVRLSKDSVRAIQEHPLANTVLQISYFPVASGPDALELCNIGAAGAAVTSLIVTSDLYRDAPREIYEHSLALRAGEKGLIYPQRYIRAFSDRHLASGYATGTEKRAPRIQVIFRYEGPDGRFETKPFTMVGKYHGQTFVDFRPPGYP